MAEVKVMDKDTETIDTSETPHCPNPGCPYIVFRANEGDNGDWYCMECGEAFDEGEVIPP